MTDEKARLLPVMDWEGREFLVDGDARQFRNVNDADDIIGMHSSQGRSMVRQMRGKEWRVFAVDTDGHNDATV